MGRSFVDGPSGIIPFTAHNLTFLANPSINGLTSLWDVFGQKCVSQSEYLKFEWEAVKLLPESVAQKLKLLN